MHWTSTIYLGNRMRYSTGASMSLPFYALVLRVRYYTDTTVLISSTKRIYIYTPVNGYKLYPLSHLHRLTLLYYSFGSSLSVACVGREQMMCYSAWISKSQLIADQFHALFCEYDSTPSRLASTLLYLWSYDHMALYKCDYYYYFLPSVNIMPRSLGKNEK